jgi:ribosome biogenesis protein Nip4
MLTEKKFRKFVKKISEQTVFFNYFNNIKIENSTDLKNIIPRIRHFLENYNSQNSKFLKKFKKELGAGKYVNSLDFNSEIYYRKKNLELIGFHLSPTKRKYFCKERCSVHGSLYEPNRTKRFWINNRPIDTASLRYL